MGAGHGRGWAFGELIGSMRGFETRMEELRIGLGCRARRGRGCVYEMVVSWE